ncbi:MAG TPA: PH domain-containing protein [Flavobacterium sp.]|nr:PH domain-containing protein [Flavobacterium sp.]
MEQMSNYDFSQPNKLARKALWLVLGNAFWTIIKGSWAIIAVLAIRGFSTNSYWLYLIFLGLIVLTFIRLSINYFYYSYQVVGDELIINKGWLSKSKTVVKLDKIHEVNLNQKLIHKIIGLYLVGVDTAGSSKTEITINGISYHKALALKEVLTNTQSKIAVDTAEHSPEKSTEEFTEDGMINEPIPQKTTFSEKISIGLPSLIKIGLTRNYLQTFALLFAFSFQIIDQVRSFLSYDADEEDATRYGEMFQASNFEQLGGLLILMFILGVVFFVVVFNLVRTFLTYYNYQINLKNNQLTVSYGLTDSHIIAVPSQKVQLFQIQQNYLQKLMNLFEVKIKQIESNENNKQKKGLVVPGANRSELGRIFYVIYQTDLEIPTDFLKPHKRILLLKFFWLCIPALIALGFFYYSETMHYAWIILPVFAFIYFLIYCGYRNEKLYIKDDFIVLKKGVWDITTTYLQISKIQQITIRQSYFQEGRHLGSLNLHTAAGTVILYYYDFKMLQKLSNELLYKIEKNNYQWM